MLRHCVYNSGVNVPSFVLTPAPQARAMPGEPTADSERPPLGGRDVDEHGVNSGLLRCPRCLSRLVSCRGRLHERQGPDASLWVPHKPSGAADAPADAVASAEDALVPEVAWEWIEQQHTWWWSVADMEEVDNDVETTPDVAKPTPPKRLIGRGWLKLRAWAARGMTWRCEEPPESPKPVPPCFQHRSTTAGSRHW